MGLDLALGVIILIAAFRGWLQGFVSQALRIAGLIACVYLAEPVPTTLSRMFFPIYPRSNLSWSTGCSGGFPPR